MLERSEPWAKALNRVRRGPTRAVLPGDAGQGSASSLPQNHPLVRTSQPFANPGQSHTAIAAVEQPPLPLPSPAGTTRSGVSRRPAGLTPPPHRPSVFPSERGRGEGGGSSTGSAGATQDPLALAAPPGAARPAVPEEMGSGTGVVPAPAVTHDQRTRRNAPAPRNNESINK